MGLQCLFCIVGEVFQSCQLAAGLYVVGTVLDVLMHCSLSAAIGEPNVKLNNSLVFACSSNLMLLLLTHVVRTSCVRIFTASKENYLQVLSLHCYVIMTFTSDL